MQSKVAVGGPDLKACVLRAVKKDKERTFGALFDDLTDDLIRIVAETLQELEYEGLVKEVRFLPHTYTSTP